MRVSGHATVRLPERVAHVLVFAANELPHELLKAIGPEGEAQSLVEALAEYDVPSDLAREAARACVNLASAWDDVITELSDELGEEVHIVRITSVTTEAAPDGSFYASGSLAVVTEKGEKRGTFSLELRHESTNGYRRVLLEVEVTV